MPACRLRLYGLTVASELTLPLVPTADDRLTPADVVIVRGEVGAAGEPLYRIDAPIAFACFRDDGAFVLHWPDARFRVSSDRIVVGAADDALAAHLLTHVVWSVVLEARGLPSLHGSAVGRDGRAVAILGRSGSGKSTAGLALLDRGWSLVADDLLAFDRERRIAAGPPYLRLTADRAAGRAATEPDQGGKHRCPTLGASGLSSLALAIVHDERFTAPTRLRGIAAVGALLSHQYSPLPTLPEQRRRRLDLAADLGRATPVIGVPPRSLSAEVIERLMEETET